MHTCCGKRSGVLVALTAFREFSREQTHVLWHRPPQARQAQGSHDGGHEQARQAGRPAQRHRRRLPRRDSHQLRHDDRAAPPVPDQPVDPGGARHPPRAAAQQRRRGAARRPRRQPQADLFAPPRGRVDPLCAQRHRPLSHVWLCGRVPRAGEPAALCQLYQGQEDGRRLANGPARRKGAEQARGAHRLGGARAEAPHCRRRAARQEDHRQEDHRQEDHGRRQPHPRLPRPRPVRALVYPRRREQLCSPVPHLCDQQ